MTLIIRVLGYAIRGLSLDNIFQVWPHDECKYNKNAMVISDLSATITLQQPAKQRYLIFSICKTKEGKQKVKFLIYNKGTATYKQ